MIFEEDTIDDILISVFNVLIKKPFDVTSSRGETSEVIGSQIILNNPRARLSRSYTKGTIFSAVGEFIWYISGSNLLNQIEYYLKRYREESDDDSTIYGAYGSRLLNFRREINQIENIVNNLTYNFSTRRAVIQIYDAKDIISRRKEIPCTCTFQFLVREEKLHMITYMRSNDAYFGLPHDIFCFTMLQEYIASRLRLEIGKYYHFAGSLHLYKDVSKKVFEYIEEGYQSTMKPMPKMPQENIENSISNLIKGEKLIREGSLFDENREFNHHYWQDIIRLLKVFKAGKEKNVNKIKQISNQITNKEFLIYVNKKLDIYQNE